MPWFDGDPPSAQILFCVLNFMLENREKGAIAVHCYGGIGNFQVECLKFVPHFWIFQLEKFMFKIWLFTK